MLLIVGSCLLVFGTLNTKVDTYCCFSSKLAYDTTYWLYFDTNNLLMYRGLQIQDNFSSKCNIKAQILFRNL